MTAYDSIKYKSTTISNLNDTGTEGSKLAVGTTAQRGSTTGQFRFNSTLELGEYYDGTVFKVIDNPPTVSSVNTPNIESSALPADVVITGVGFSSTITSVKFIGNDATEITSGTVVRDSSTQITAQVPDTVTSANEPWDVQVTNSSTLKATLADGINIDAYPVFGVAAGSLGTLTDDTRAASNVTNVTATDDEGDTVTFSVTSGSIPSGLTFGSNGVWSGTADAVGSNTTSTFTVTATDSNNTISREYSIIVQMPTATGGTKTTYGDYTVHTFLSTANFVLNTSKALDVLIVGGGAGGGCRHGGGGGAGGLIEITGSTALSGTYVCTIGPGGGITTGAGAGNDGTDTTFVCAANSVTFTADGGGGGASFGAATGRDGGSGGGAGPYHNDAGLGLSSATQAASPSMTGLSGGTGVGYGFRGGGNPGNHAAGGGGGAGSVGGDAVDQAGGEASDDGGVGGNGRICNLDGLGYYYAGGGGGGSRGAYAGGAGTHGGGGACSEYGSAGSSQGAAGTSARNSGTAGSNSGSIGIGGSAGANTGSGGGGVSQANGDVDYSTSSYSGAGGSGIIIIRYLT
jgi:hypothetical protein